jgi:SulP family sulfate permease
MAAILISVTAKYHLEGVFLATLLAGIILIFAGIFHLGRLTAYIPSPVITGFTSGIAIIIALGQLDNLLGVRSAGDSALAKLASLRDAGPSLNFSSLAIGAFVIIFMLLFPKKLGAAIPASLVGIAAATVLAAVLGLDADTVGEIPKTLVPDRRLTPPDITPGAIANLVLPSVSIASLGMVESLMCGASAGRMTGVRLDNDRELVAQGIGNILLPFFGESRRPPLSRAQASPSSRVQKRACPVYSTRRAGCSHCFCSGRPCRKSPWPHWPACLLSPPGA